MEGPTLAEKRQATILRKVLPSLKKESLKLFKKRNLK